MFAGRRPPDPEVKVDDSARNEKIDCFAINALHHMGPFKPLIDVIFLNRKLLTGTGVQSPAAFQSLYMDIARQEVNMFLRVIPRVDPRMSPKFPGQISAVSKNNLDEGVETMSIGASLFEELNAGIGGGGGGALDFNDAASMGGDAMSMGSAASAQSTMSTASQRSALRESAGFMATKHPVLEFIPVVSKLFIAFARAKQEIFTWSTFEEIVRSTVVETVMAASEVPIESPFVNMPFDHRLRKILEATIEMAKTKHLGQDSRESALELSSTMGKVLGLNSDLIAGMLAVVDKSPTARQKALVSLSKFLAENVHASKAGSENTKASTHVEATISGIVALASGDYDGARPMALKLGGFDVPSLRPPTSPVFSHILRLHEVVSFHMCVLLYTCVLYMFYMCSSICLYSTIL